MKVEITDKIRCYNMDCMEFMKGVPDKYYDLAICDLEYGIDAGNFSDKPNIVKQKNGSYLKVNKPTYSKKNWDKKKSDSKIIDEIIRVSKKQIIWGGNYYGLSGGYLVWDKLNGTSDQFGCELAWLSFSQRTDIVYYMWQGMFHGVTASQNVMDAIVQQGNKKLNESRIHPTQKPVKLYKWLLDKYAKEGDKIIDTHGGSMSIGIACHDYDFELDIIELDKDYFNTAVKRLKWHVKQQKLF